MFVPLHEGFKSTAMERRKFITKSFLLGAAAIGSSFVLNSCSKDDDNGNGGTPSGTTVDLTLSKYASLNTSGGYAYVGNIIVINSAGTYIALSKICTHEGCTVAFSSAADKIVCDCHGSSFSKSGSVLNGPATSPLKLYTVTQEGDILTIK